MSSQLEVIALATGAIAALLIMIIRFRMQPFIALLVVSVLTGLASGMAPPNLIDFLLDAMGGTLGDIAAIIGLGAMFGEMLRASGGLRTARKNTH